MGTIFNLSKCNLKKNISKSFLIIITIALTTTLLTSVGITCANWLEANTEITIKRAGAYDGLYRGITEEEYNKIKADENVELSSIRTTFGRVKNEDNFLSIMYLDENTPEMINMKLEEGRFPTEYNEIAIQSGYLENILNMPAKVGQTIQLEYEINTTKEIIKDEFIITGIIKTEDIHNNTKSYTAVASEDYFNKHKNSDINYTVCILVNKDEKLSGDEIKYTVEQIGENAGVSKFSVEVNEDYINASNPDPAVIGGGIIIAFIVIISSVIVIYSIFYVSIINKVQEFGKIKAIGATLKQIKLIVLTEGLILSTIAIPIGLILGNIISNTVIIKIMNFAQFNVGKYNIMINIAVFLMVYLTVFISLIKPMNIAGRISPVEAMRYTGEIASDSNERVGNNEINILKLTIANITRFKKRTCITLISLSLSGILFITISAVLNSIDAEKMSRLRMPCDFTLSLKNYTVGDGEGEEDEVSIEELQSFNPLGSDMQKIISDIPGVNKIETYHGVRGEFYLDDGQKTDIILSGFKESDLEKIQSELIDGEINYESLIKDDVIICSDPSEAEAYNLNIGDKIKMNIYDIQGVYEKEYTIVAMSNISNLGSPFIIADEVINSLTSQETEFGIDIYIKDGKYDSVEEELNKLLENEDFIKMKGLKEVIEGNKREITITKTLGYALVIIIGVIGFMNLVNTMITSIIARKRELSIMQAIGLTNKQLVMMLNLEGIFYVGGTLAITLTLGNILGYIAFIIFKNTGASYAIYSYPLAQTIIMIVVLIIAQSLISFGLCKSFNKDSLVDRIRYSE